MDDEEVKSPDNAGPTDEVEAPPVDTGKEVPAEVGPEGEPAPATEKNVEHEFKKAENGISRIKSALAEAAKGDQMKNVAREMINTTKSIFTRLKDFGLELPKERETFRQAVVAIKNKEYIKGCQLTLKTKSMLEKSQREYINKSLARPRSFLNNIQVCIIFTGEKKQEMAEELNEIESLYNCQEFKKAIMKLNEYTVKETAIKLNLQKKEEFIVFREKVNELVKMANDGSIDISDELEKLGKTDSLMEDRNVDEALSLLEETGKNLENKIEQKMIEDARTAIEKGQALMEANQDNIDLSDIASRLENANSEFEAGEYKNAYEVSSEIIQIIEEARGNKQIKELSNLLTNIEKSLIENEEMGAYTLKSEAYLYKAKYVFEKNEYADAYRLAVEAEKAIKDARKDFYVTNVKSLLEEAGELMTEAAGLDLNISRFDKVFEIVNELYDGGELEKANDTAAEAMGKLTETIYGKLQDIIAMKFPTIRNEMDEAKAIGADITEEIEEFLKIELLNKEGKYREVINEVEELKRSVDRKISLRRKETYLEKIEEARKEISEVSAKTEMEYPDLAEYIDSGMTLLESEDYEALDGIIEGFAKLKEEHLNNYRRDQYRTEIMQLEEMMAEMKALGIELPTDLVANLEELKKKEE